MQFHFILLGILVLTQFFLRTNEKPTDKPNKNAKKNNKTERLNLKKSKDIEVPDDDDIDTLPLRINDKPKSPERFQDLNQIYLNVPRSKESSGLDNLPRLKNFLGIDLKTGTYVVSALGIVHVFFYGCTVFMQLSYMLITIWVLVTIYSTLSAVLFFTLYEYPVLILHIWIWYALIFVALMFMMMILVGLVLCAKAEHHRLFIIVAGMLWYALTVYFILVVNSYRMELIYTAPQIPSTDILFPSEMLHSNQNGNQQNPNEKESVRSALRLNNEDNQDENPEETTVKTTVETTVETTDEDKRRQGVIPVWIAHEPPS